MTRADYIRQMTDDELVKLLVWRKFDFLEYVPDCDEDCEHFKGGCANSCPHERKERAVREWITESIDDAKQQIEEMLIEHWKDEIEYLEDRLKEFQEK